MVVATGPREAPNRTSANQRHMLMGHNQVMLHLLAETTDLNWRERHVLLERAFGRAWKWQRRRCGASLASRWFWLYALAKLTPPTMVARLLPMTLTADTRPWRADGVTIHDEYRRSINTITVPCLAHAARVPHKRICPSMARRQVPGA